MNPVLQKIEDIYMVFYGELPTKDRNDYLKRLCRQLGLSETSPTMIDIIANDALNQRLIDFPKRINNALNKIDNDFQWYKEAMIERFNAHVRSQLSDFNRRLFKNLNNHSVKINKLLICSISAAFFCVGILIGFFIRGLFQ